MDYGYYIVASFGALRAAESYLREAARYVTQQDGMMLAALKFKDSYNKAQWNATGYVEIPASDQKVVDAVKVFPAMVLP